MRGVIEQTMLLTEQGCEHYNDQENKPDIVASYIDVMNSRGAHSVGADLHEGV